MRNNDFSILLNAIINKSGINTELKQVQEIVNKYSIDIMPELKTASLKNQMKSVSKEIANDINKALGTNLTGNDVFKAYENQAKKIQQDQQTRIKESTSLLQKEKAEYKTIYDLQIKISKLNPYDNKDEVSVLQKQLSLHEAYLKSIQDKITTYSDVINNETRINSLLEQRIKINEQQDLINAKQNDTSFAKDVESEKARIKEISVAEEQAYAENITRDKQKYLVQEQAYNENESRTRKMALLEEQANKEDEFRTKQKIALEKQLYLAREEAEKTNKSIDQSSLNLKSNKVQLDNRISAYLYIIKR